MIAVAIKLDLRGPVLFRQRRMGRDGEVFEMLKFRTMVDGADELKAEPAARNEAATASSRSPTIRASRASGGFCAARRSTSCRSSSTCSAGR